MESLKFICPNTQHSIDSGIEADVRAFHVIESQNVQVKCPRCGATHCFSFKDGLAAKVARGVAAVSAPSVRHA